MRFAYTIVYVDDVAATLGFYRDAFDLPTRFLHESGDWGELDTGTTALAFSSRALMRQLGKDPSVADPAAPSFEVALVTEDVDGALERALRAGAVLRSPAETMPWGQRVAYVSDPNGVLVELCTPVGAQP